MLVAIFLCLAVKIFHNVNDELYFSCDYAHDFEPQRCSITDFQHADKQNLILQQQKNPLQRMLKRALY